MSMSLRPYISGESMYLWSMEVQEESVELVMSVKHFSMYSYGLMGKLSKLER